jgi:class 3 adenylate cyclase/CHASE2 domain-containing sensor protein
LTGAKPTTVRRHRFLRAVARGDTRLGLFVGAATTLVVAALFAVPERVGVVHRLELAALDLGFQRRTPIVESPKLAVIGMDDITTKRLRYPFPRRYFGEVVLALDRLGARQIVFDVEFQMRVPRADDYDADTGAFKLDRDDTLLRTAIAKAGNVRLAYHLELKDLVGGLRPDFERVKAAFATNLGAEPEEIARVSGIARERLEEDFEAARAEAAVSLVAERLDRTPGLDFAALKAQMLPNFSPGAQQEALNLLHYGYWRWKARALMEAKASLLGVTERPARAGEGVDLTPPAYAFLEKAAGVGCANSVPDVDGVLRRPWAVLFHGRTPHPYLGLSAAVRDKGAIATMELFGDRLIVRGPDDVTTIPLDAEGRVLVNWAGSQARPRDATYAQVPFLAMTRYYQQYFGVLDQNMKAFILKTTPEERTAVHRDYLALSERLGVILRGEREGTPEEIRDLDQRMSAIREEAAAGMERGLKDLEERIPKTGSARIREQLEAARGALLKNLPTLRAARAEEVELRKLVAGRVCFIGSVGTASGDLHSSPLRGGTPGVDAHVGVANMVLTGRALRHAPVWAGLTYLLVVGLGVSFGVSHWNATWSAVFTAGVVAAAVLVFFGCFSGASLIVPGAGPVATAVAAFASVTAFKELVTQRSKRKLQKELEKSTSPELVKILMEHPEYLSEPRKMRGTFFFSDVKSFTSISEKMAAEVLFPFINRYLDRMTRSLKARRAYLDKYIGDGIMALFGVPVSSPDHARNACLAALECQAALAQLNAEFALEGHPQLKSRIGLNSGEVSAGYMGGAERSDYSVLGDAVNLAARLEGANKEYGTSIMLSDSTRELIGNGFVVRELDRIRVVGKREPTIVFELIALAGAPLPFPAAYLEAYDGSLKAYRERRWGKAIDGFRAALALRPDDKASEVYIERCEAFQENPPSGDWDGVFELTSK